MESMPVHETKTHGTAALPYTVYHSIIPELIPSFPLHWHDDFELIYGIRGQVLVTVWGQAYRLCAGDLVVVLPRGVHSIDQSGGETGEYYNIMFHPSLFKGAGDDPCYTKYVLPFLNGKKSMECFHPADSSFNRAVAPCLLSILEHRRDGYSTHELLMKSQLFLLLHCMNQYAASSSDHRLLHLSCSQLKNALYYVQHFYDQKVTVQKAALQCGLSESHFMKLFRELTGTSFNAYLINYRLELAARQLSDTRLKVIDIAENCGFRNHSYFTRAFREKYGRTPSEYRKLSSPRELFST
ncbi:MAG: AraC family transcriptional regulator [Lachnospiraceae bacterium]|nr:AraC family transcriptional regulator [Lachnospiraceae bacterium]